MSAAPTAGVVVTHTKGVEMRGLRVLLVALVVLAVLPFVAPLASAQRARSVYPPPPPDITPTRIERTIDPPDKVLGNRLSRTGADVTLYVLIGLGAIATGTFIVRRSRSKKARA